MSAALFVLVIFLNGILINSLFNVRNKSVFIITAFVFGSLISISLIYFLNSYVIHNLFYSILSFIIVSVIIQSRNLSNIKKILINIRKVNLIKIAIYVVIFFFSWYLFNKTFSYHDGNFFSYSGHRSLVGIKAGQARQGYCRFYFCCRPVSDWHHPDVLSRTSLLI